ncbi:MAG TPA: cell wall-binding repeat-containing protein [Nonomuraea sp.]|nr:cell wall-binding repeat-containing protein [Nonomuraea sp.]
MCRGRTTRVVMWCAALVLTLVPTVSTSTPAGAAPNEVLRVSGTDRFATAAAVSAATSAVNPPYAFLATGMAFPDALAAGAVAGATRSPVLLTRQDVLPEVTRRELERLRPNRVIVLGGEAAVSNSVASSAGIFSKEPLQRIAGSDRFATAAAIAKAVYPTSGVPVAYVATGEGFADALAGGPSAAVRRGPLLLVTSGSIPEATSSELRRLGPRAITVLGGSAAVSDAVVEQLRGFTNGVVTRLSGADRYSTAVAVSASSFDARVPVVLVATGRSFPDALGGAPVGGSQGGPLLLVAGTSVPDTVWTELDRLQPQRILVLGGVDVISQAVEDQLRQGCARGPCDFGPSYTFVHVDAEGRPARWNPCKEIHYRVNATRVPEGGLNDLKTALIQLNQRTGLRFIDDGPTTMHPGELKTGDPNKPPSPQLLIGWTKPGDPGHPTGSEDGEATIHWGESPKPGPVVYAATIAIDATRPLNPGFARGDSQGLLLLHELGHAVGLDHVQDKDQVMQPQLTASGPTSYGPGDQQGLTKLGVDAGCQA